MSFGDCWHTSATHQETSGKRGANFLILNQLIFTGYTASDTIQYTQKTPLLIFLKGFPIIMDNIKNDVK